MIQRISSETLGEALGRVGLRSTRQRELVFDVLMQTDAHPTADEVLARAREVMPSISLATVYNCLETLVECALVKAVNLEREPTRYCANLREHGHFHDVTSGNVYDVPLSNELLENVMKQVPEGFIVERIELNFIGRRLLRGTQKPL
ncbi:MAG: transcriptional repressor [Opitutales bacterium]|nr:transcriptional repressor [Opitutales bacterium]